MFRWHRHLSKCFDRMQTALSKWNKTMSVIAVNFFFWGSVGEGGKPTGGPLIVNHVETWRERTERKEWWRRQGEFASFLFKKKRGETFYAEGTPPWSVERLCSLLNAVAASARSQKGKEKTLQMKRNQQRENKTRNADRRTHTKAKQNNSFRPYKAF